MKPKPVSKVVLYLLVFFIVANVAVTIFFLWPVIETELLPTSTIVIPPTSVPTATVALTEVLPTIIPTETPPPTAIPPTVTPTEVNASIKGLEEQGVMVLSMADGFYFHLFAFHPQYLPLLRLTEGDWDDINPAISPDGKRVAYSSHRNGYWDLYILDIQSSSVTQLTSTPEYEGNPTWSPDGQWLAYETYIKGNLDIYLLEVAHPENKPLELTNDPSTDFSPRWIPGGNGRQIAFVSDRSGEDEIWIARLDNFKERFVNISRDAEGKDTRPDWSPDGRFLAWAKKKAGDEALVILDMSDPNLPVRPAGSGDWPVWNPTGTSLVTRVRQANLTAIASYETSTGQITIPLIRLPGALQGLDWHSASLPEALSPRLSQAPSPSAKSLWTPMLNHDPLPTGTDALVPLDGVVAPYPALLDSIDESFYTLRAKIGELIGWDLLNSLEAAFTDKDSPIAPGTGISWLSTGRGIMINSLPLNSGWMALVKEDIGIQTYWRVFLKTRNQDGSQGRPMTDRAWDILSRNSGDASVYEKGGKEINVPEGYWIDFTEWAGRYGWERFPATANWITYYPGARFTLFAQTENLDLNTALNQIYPDQDFSRPFIRPTLTPFPTPKPDEPTATPVTNEEE